jgi:hypothetical protein
MVSMIHYVFMLQDVMAKKKRKRYMQSTGYVTCMEGVQNISCLNLMAGTSLRKKQKSEISNNHACKLDLILYFLI